MGKLGINVQRSLQEPFEKALSLKANFQQPEGIHMGCMAKV